MEVDEPIIGFPASLGQTQALFLESEDRPRKPARGQGDQNRLLLLWPVRHKKLKGMKIKKTLKTTGVGVEKQLIPPSPEVISPSKDKESSVVSPAPARTPSTSTPSNTKVKGQTTPTSKQPVRPIPPPPVDLPSFQFLCQAFKSHLAGNKVSLEEEHIDTFFVVGLRALAKQAFLVSVKPGGKAVPIILPADEVPGRICITCVKDVCLCLQIIELFKEINGIIQQKNLVNALSAPRLYKIIKEQINLFVVQTCIGKFDNGHMDRLFKWLEALTPWLEIIYPLRKSNSRGPPRKIKEELELTTLVHQVYGNAMVNNLFAMIIEYPDSKPMLDDLRICMRTVNLREILVKTLRSELNRRLLNPGVNTSDVLDAYVSTVRALKYLDPTGILVQLVTPPVRSYLKDRDETVRVILVSLTEETGDLCEELTRNPVCAERRTKIDATNWFLWEPDPIDVPKDRQNLRKSDLIQALVSIYGSKTLFIDEYRALLADRLLRLPKPGSITREIKCLELLKLRFGESDLQKCEVMLKDVSDSHRMNLRFYEEEGAVLANQEIDVTGLIVSAQFWPAFKQEALELPENVKKALENYTKAFEMVKGNRSLEWQRHIGSVDLEIEHGGTLLNFTVTPAQATIIYHFQEKESWTLEELSEITAIPTSSLKSKVNFWVTKGVLLHTSPDVYHLHNTFNSENRKTVGESSNRYIEDDEVGSSTISTSTQRETELQVFWSYIEGMLTNLDSLPLSRIHSMLKLFATVECSLDELQKFLDEKVVQNFLVFSGGQYQLPK